MSDFLPFYAAKNLKARAVSPSRPWEFIPDAACLAGVRALKKEARRAAMLEEATEWNIFTPLAGLNQSLRISDANPAQRMVGISIDYDAKMPLEEACKLIDAALPEKLRPNYLEHSLSVKNRLHWCFAFEALTVNNPHAEAVIRALSGPLKIPSLLPGFDEASYKPSQLWTNGGEWYRLKDTPLDRDFVWGILAGVGSALKITDRQEIPLEIIADEIQKRWPGRWTADFKVDAQGVRFWDPQADNATGSQVKPDGMLCFTGPVPFMPWGDILGHQWVAEKRASTIGKAGDGLHFDGRDYWRLVGGVWRQVARVDVGLHLQSRGLSDRVPKGKTISDVGEVMVHIQNQNRVDGASAFVNYAPGVITIAGRKFLNTTNLVHVSYADIIPTSFREQCPHIWELLEGFFAGETEEERRMALATFLAWNQRSLVSFDTHTPMMGQALFICGPVHNGKTLINTRLLTPLLGGRSSNPWDYISGLTAFNSENFESFLLAINDEEAPRSEAQKRAIESRLKSLTVNIHHQIHEKYKTRVQIEWIGRIVVTLNDDPTSIRMLPEVHSSMRDKVMFFRSQPFKGVWASNKEIETHWAKEVPFYASNLLAFEVPKEIREQSRYGIKSYYDPYLLSVSQEQAKSYNLLEIIQTWAECESTWEDDLWEGSPTKLHGDLSNISTTANIMRDWNQAKIGDALASLAKTAGSGVTYHIDGDSRHFVISKSKILQ